jgi:predicted DNA-binding protein
MPRPIKILEETKTYNLLMTVEQWDKLSNMSREQTKTSLEQVSVADLIREAIDIYIQILEDENEET